LVYRLYPVSGRFAPTQALLERSTAKEKEEMTSYKPNFERYLTAIRRQEPDRVPNAELGIDPEVKDALLGRPVKSLKDEIDFFLAAGYDFLLVDTDLYAAPQIQQAILNPHENTATTYSAHRQDRGWATGAAKAITSWKDVEQFPWPKASELDYTIYDEVKRQMPDGMQAVTTFGHLFTSAWQLMGFENFCVALIEDPDLVQNIIDRLGGETMLLLENVLAHDCVGAICIQDDIAYTSGPMISPRLLRKIFFPWLKRVADIAHAYNRPLLFHSDGDVSKVMEDIVAAGVDLLHPIEPKCMDIVAIKKAYGDRLALMGNVDLGYTLTRGTPDEVRQEVKHLIENVAPGGGYLLSSANSITNYVPLENYKAMLDATREFGRYPISL
jgi:uroporphyrinogen decarboxylase